MANEKHEAFVRELLKEAATLGRRGDDPDALAERLLKKYINHRRAQATEAWCDET